MPTPTQADVASRLRPEHFWPTDGLARAARALRLGPVGLGVGLLLYGALHTLLLPAVFGHLHTHGAIVGALDDWPLLVILLGMVPVLVGYYLWQPQTICQMFAGVLARTTPRAVVEARLQEFQRALASPLLLGVALLIAATQVAFSVSDLSQAAPRWQNINFVMVATLQPMRFVGFYCVTFIVGRHLLALLMLNQLFREAKVEIAPLHPDQAGGLRMLGDYLLSATLAVALLSLNFGLTLLRARTDPTVVTPGFFVEFVVYLTVGPALFLAPLWNIHLRMAEARTQLLAEVAEQFDVEYHRLLADLRQDQLQAESVTHLDAVQKIYHIAAAAPEWPFNVEILSKFTAAIFVPLLGPILVERVVQLLFA